MRNQASKKSRTRRQRLQRLLNLARTLRLPTHLAYQSVDYIRFLRQFADRIFHVHVKDVW
jgi:hypothetical protein